MACFEFYCDACRHKFEQITRAGEPDMGKCPKCGSQKTRKLISKFAVGGQGDLRESTMHGCHDYTGVGESHDHDHAGHDHSGHDHGDGGDHD